MSILSYFNFTRIKGLLKRISQDELKIASIGKELAEYKNVLAGININQEATQEESGYSIIPLPKNVANGQVGVGVKGVSLRNELNYTRDTWEEWDLSLEIDIYNQYMVIDNNANGLGAVISINVKPSTKYGVLANIKINTRTIGFELYSHGSRTRPFPAAIVVSALITGNIKNIQTTKEDWTHNEFGSWFLSDAGKVEVGEYRVFELPSGSEIESDFENLTADELAIKYPYIKGGGTKSTLAAMRLRSVGKNLFDKNNAIYGTNYVINELTGKIIPTHDNCGDSYTNFIKINPYTSYKLSGGSLVTYCPYALYDANYNYMRGGGSKNFSFPGDWPVSYIRFSLLESEKDNIQLQQSTTATPYEPYKESTQYLLAKDGENIAELRSLPNGVRDEIKDGMLYQETIKILLDGSFNWYLDNTSENTYRVTIVAEGVFPANKESTTTLNSRESNKDMPYNLVSTVTDDNRLLGFRLDHNRFYIRVEKTKIDAMTGANTTAKFKAYLNQYPITLTYQLATPITLPIQTSGTLVSHPSGTVYIEPAVADAGIYTNKIEILHQDLPIHALEKISTVDFATGIETELDPSTAVIAGDGLSFTHPGLATGDIVFFTYFYDESMTTQGEATIEYYDSRYVLTDSVTGKYYKVVQAVADGVLSQSLVEV